MDLVVAGLDAHQPRTVELAFVVTDGDLHVVAEGPSVIIREPGLSFEPADDWSHAESDQPGRFDGSPASSLRQAETALLEFLTHHCNTGDPSGNPPLAGHGVYRDRPFLHRYMPDLDGFLHYRIIDVATIEELVRRWYPTIQAAAPAQPESQSALDHIRTSIRLLRYYREHVFR
jgi:oligoribonuclease